MSNSVKKPPVFSSENPTTSHSKFTCQYIQEFRNLDKYNKRYITDVEALNYFRTQHSLSKDDFELIVDVSNTDNNNNTLNEEEFAIAMHLIDIMNNKAKEESAASSSLALHEAEQKSLKGSSNQDIKTHLGHHNMGRRCKELLDILYKEQSVWNSNRQGYSDPNILRDSLDRLRDNQVELMDIYNELRRQVEECEKSTEITSQQISKELDELKSKPITQINDTNDANELPLNENSALPYLSIVKPSFVKEGNENELSRDDPENHFAPQPQRNVRDRQMNSPNRNRGVPQALSDSTDPSWSSRGLGSDFPINELQNNTKESDTPQTIDKIKSALNQTLPFTSALTSEPTTSTDKNDRMVKSNDDSTIESGIIVPSVVGEFPGDFGKLQSTSQESTADKRSGDESKSTGLLSGYLSGAINQLKSAVGVQQSNDLSVSNVTSPIIVSSVIGEFPGNFGKGTLESAALNNENAKKTDLLANTAQNNDSLKDADTNTEKDPTDHIFVNPEFLDVKSVTGQFPGDFGKEVLEEAESTSRSSSLDLKAPINSEHIDTLSKKPLNQDHSKESTTIAAQLDQDSYKVKSVIGEFPGDFGKPDVLYNKSPAHNPIDNQAESNGLSGYLSGTFGQIKSIVVGADEESKATKKSTSTTSSIIENPIIVSSVIGEFPGDFGKDVLESTSRNICSTSQIIDPSVQNSDQDNDKANANKISGKGKLTPTGIDQNDCNIKSVVGDFPGSFGKDVIESIASQSVNTHSKEIAPSIESTQLEESQNTDIDDSGSGKAVSEPKSLEKDSLIVKSVIGEFPGEFGKLDNLSNETAVQDKDLINSGKKGFLSGYLSGLFNPFAYTSDKEKTTTVLNTSNTGAVPSVIGEFPGNFGKDVIESAESNSRPNNNLETEQNENSVPLTSAITANDVNEKGIKKSSFTSKRKKRQHPKDYDGVHKLSNVSTIREIGDIHGIPTIYGLVHRGIHPVDSSDEDFSSESQASSDGEVSTGAESNIRDLFEMNDAEDISNNDSTSVEKNSNNIVNNEMNSPLKESHSTNNVKIYDSPSLVSNLFNRQTSPNEYSATSDSDVSDIKEQAAQDRHNSLHIQSQASENEVISDIHLKSADDVSVASSYPTSNIHRTDTNDTTSLKENTIPSRIRCAITKEQGLPSDVSLISRNVSTPIHSVNGEHHVTHLNGTLEENQQFIKDFYGFTNRSNIFNSRVFLDNTNHDIATKKSDTKNKQGSVACTSSTGEKPLLNSNRKTLNNKTTVTDINDLSADEISIISQKKDPLIKTSKEPYFNETPQGAGMTGKFSSIVNKSSSTESTISNQKSCIQSTSSGINDGIGSDSATSANLQNIKPKVPAEYTTLKNVLVPKSEKNDKTSQSQRISNISEAKKSSQHTNKNKMSEYYLVKPLPGVVDTKAPNNQSPTNVESPKVLTSSWNPENAPFNNSSVNEALPTLTENGPKNQTQDEKGNSSPTDKAKESIRNMKHKIKSVLKTDSNINNSAPAKSYDPTINDVITARQEYRPNAAKKSNGSPFIRNIDIKTDDSGRNPYVLDSVYMYMNKAGVDNPSIDVPGKTNKMNPVSSLLSSNAPKDSPEGYQYDPNVNVSTPITEDKKSKVRRRISLSFGKVKSSIKDIRRKDSKHIPSNGGLENSYFPNPDNNTNNSIEVPPISQPNLSPRAKEKSPMISDAPNTYYSVVRPNNQDNNESDTQDERFLDPQTKYHTEVDLIRKNSYNIFSGNKGVKSTRRPEYMYDSAGQYDSKPSPKANRNNAPLKIRDRSIENTQVSTENIQPNAETTGDSTMSTSSIDESNQNVKNVDPSSMVQSEVPESKAITDIAVTSENNEKDSSNSKDPVTGEDQNTHQTEALMSKEPLMGGSSKHSIGVPDIEEANVTQIEPSDDTCIQSNKTDPLASSTDGLSESLTQHPHGLFPHTKNDLDRNESVLENVTNECEGSESLTRFGEMNISDQHLAKVKSSGSGR